MNLISQKKLPVYLPLLTIIALLVLHIALTLKSSETSKVFKKERQVQFVQNLKNCLSSKNEKADVCVSDIRTELQKSSKNLVYEGL